MTTDDDEREAREWLKKAIVHDGGRLISPSLEADKHRATILALLDRRVLPRPEEVPKAMLNQMWSAYAENGGGQWGMQCALHVLHDHYTQSPTPEPVEAWTLRLRDGRLHGVYPTKEEALLVSNELHSGSRIVRLVEDRDGR